MKKIVTFTAVLALMVSSAFAGEMSSTRAARLGLGGMRPMSQSQGAQIRGMGVSFVFGASRASVLGTSSTNGYAGLSATNNSLAAGANLSFASVLGITAVSGGGSVAYAK